MLLQHSGSTYAVAEDPSPRILPCLFSSYVSTVVKVHCGSCPGPDALHSVRWLSDRTAGTDRVGAPAVTGSGAPGWGYLLQCRDRRVNSE